MATIFAFYEGKTVGQIAAIEITIDHLLDIMPSEAELPREMFVIDPNKGLNYLQHTVNNQKIENFGVINICRSSNPRSLPFDKSGVSYSPVISRSFGYSTIIPNVRTFFSPA